MQKRFTPLGFVLALLASALSSASDLNTALAGVVVEPAPVGARGVDDTGAIGPAPQVSGTTDLNGDVAFEIENLSNRSATDVHVRVLVPVGGRVSFIEFLPSAASGADGFTTTITGEHAFAEQPDPDDVPLDRGESGTLSLRLEDARRIQLKTGDPFELEIWWTRNAIPISWFGTDEFGDGTPRTAVVDAVAGIDTSLSTASAATVAAAMSPDLVMCPDLPLGECDGNQFQNGSIVVSASDGLSFDLSSGVADVSAYEIDGDSAPLTSISFSDLRIDDAGNFVFDVTRDATDTQHFVLVVTGLDVVFPEGDDWDTDALVTAGVSGSAIAGICVENLWDLVDITS